MKRPKINSTDSDYVSHCQSEIAATNFYDSGGVPGEELGEILDEMQSAPSRLPTRLLLFQQLIR